MSETVMITREEYEGLSTSVALFRQVADSAPVLIWLSGVDTLCTWLNKPWIEFRGRTLEQEMGNGWSEGIHKEDYGRCVKVYLSNFEKRSPFQIAACLVLAIRTVKWPPRSVGGTTADRDLDWRLSTPFTLRDTS